MTRGWRVFAASLWLVMIAIGMVVVARHGALAGADSVSPSRWPAHSALVRDPSRPTLLCFVHPRCPCTRATIRELERIVSHSPPAAVRIVFRDDPEGDVTSAETWSMAARIPNALRVRDPGGGEARRFGAATSGLVMLFGADGSLRFRGGVTRSRGHEGESVGGVALGRALRGDRGAARWARVFGCGLMDQ